MNLNIRAQREAFQTVPETCPKVDDALHEAGNAIKELTGALRTALVDALERAIDAEKERDRLEDEVSTLTARVAELEAACTF